MAYHCHKKKKGKMKTTLAMAYHCHNKKKIIVMAYRCHRPECI